MKKLFVLVVLLTGIFILAGSRRSAAERGPLSCVGDLLKSSFNESIVEQASECFNQAASTVRRAFD